MSLCCKGVCPVGLTFDRGTTCNLKLVSDPKKETWGIVFKVLYDRVYSLFQSVGSEKFIIKNFLKFSNIFILYDILKNFSY
jgi:hypothetical protein